MTGISLEVLLQGDANIDWMEVLRTQLVEIEKYTNQHEYVKEDISKVDVGWHLSHSLLVIHKVYEALAASDEENYAWSFNVMRSTMLLTGKIARGRAKSPKVALPTSEISVSTIRQQLILVESLLTKLKELPKKANFEHPIVGQLHRDQAIQFLQIHTKHHLAIIADILKQ